MSESIQPALDDLAADDALRTEKICQILSAFKPTRTYP